MKYPQGFVWLPILAVIAIVFGISGSAYWYVHSKTNTSLTTQALPTESDKGYAWRPAADTLSTQPSTFLYVKNGIIYCDNKPLQPSADLNTFQVLSAENTSYSYWKDSRSVWNGCDLIEGADPATFEPVGRKEGSGYMKDRSHVWLDDTVMVGADPATFTFIAMDGLNAAVGYMPAFAKDKKNVYYNADIIPQADPTTFSLLPTTNGGQSGYEKDKNSVYFADKLILGADVSTFAVVSSFDPEFYSTIPKDGIDARDKYHAYFGGEAVSLSVSPASGPVPLTATRSSGPAPLSLWFMAPAPRDNKVYTVDTGDGKVLTMVWDNGSGLPGGWSLGVSYMYSVRGTYTATLYADGIKLSTINIAVQ